MINTEKCQTQQANLKNLNAGLTLKKDDSIKINCYRILQESIQNINKYAKATEVKIEFYNEKQNLKLTNKINTGIKNHNFINIIYIHKDHYLIICYILYYYGK